jgi:tetratricopeptide (TPR) repeat protein
MLAGIFACALIAGCATTSKPTEAEQRASLDTLIKQADGELANGRSEQSIALLNQAAKENPTSMVPWLRMSNIWFNAGNYPSAILTANEVLKRDAGNQEAKSILVVAGLRVAAGAITGLVQRNEVNFNAHKEAENLTQALRSALGEKVLVPAPAAEQSPAPSQHHYAKHTARKTYPTHSATPVASNAPAATASNSSGSEPDPFKSLK